MRTQKEHSAGLREIYRQGEKSAKLNGAEVCGGRDYSASNANVRCMP